MIQAEWEESNTTVTIQRTSMMCTGRPAACRHARCGRRVSSKGRNHVEEDSPTMNMSGTAHTPHGTGHLIGLSSLAARYSQRCGTRCGVMNGDVQSEARGGHVVLLRPARAEIVCALRHGLRKNENGR